ncbi:MAG TPA: MBL fold metallo-hydrolase [Streptosporangiaceae bacterium]|nr:MBL fold metallo-hydrolase [Streptosporangiaceae bacterium]
MLEIASISTPSLGDRSYLATDGSAALVIDPQRDFDRVLAVAAEYGVPVTHVFETHIHNDYVTGGLALCQATGADYHVNGADRVAFDRVPVGDGDKLKIGGLTLKVVATPGHTFNHLAYVLEHDGETVAVFSGGSLLNGSTGRTDLLGSQHSAELARAQHASARRLASELPSDAVIYATHGFGSFCSATQTSGEASTIGDELAANPALTLTEADYVATTLAGLDLYPAYYVHMAPENAGGPSAPDLTPPRAVISGELRRRIDAGEWVVDLRSRVAFAAGHLRGVRHFELSDSMATYLGWLIPWGAPLTLIGPTPESVAAAQRDLVRIGIERIEAAATGKEEDWACGEPLSGYPIMDFSSYEKARDERQVVLLDVRREAEWRTERIDGAVHIPLHELGDRTGEIPAGEVWVHCMSGYRASVAASMLDAAGRDVVLINDHFAAARRSGLADTEQSGA